MDEDQRRLLRVAALCARLRHEVREMREPPIDELREALDRLCDWAGQQLDSTGDTSTETAPTN